MTYTRWHTRPSQKDLGCMVAPSSMDTNYCTVFTTVLYSIGDVQWVYTSGKTRQWEKEKGDFFCFFLFMYVIQHCFICRPQIPLCRRMITSNHATLALTARHANRSTRSHPKEKKDVMRKIPWKIRFFGKNFILGPSYLRSNVSIEMSIRRIFWYLTRHIQRKLVWEPKGQK